MKGVLNGGGGSVAIMFAIVAMKLAGNSDGELNVIVLGGDGDSRVRICCCLI